MDVFILNPVHIHAVNVGNGSDSNLISPNTFGYTPMKNHMVVCIVEGTSDREQYLINMSEFTQEKNLTNVLSVVKIFGKKPFWTSTLELTKVTGLIAALSLTADVGLLQRQK